MTGLLRLTTVLAVAFALWPAAVYAQDFRPPFSTRLAGDGHQRIFDMAVDPATGDVIVVGATSSLPGPFSYRSPAAGKDDGFVVRYGADLSMKFTAIIGGAENDEIRTVAIAPNGSILLAGNTLSGSASFPVSQFSFDKNADRGDPEGFFAVLTKDGRLEYSSLLGGIEPDVCFDILSLDGDRAVIVGGTESLAKFPGVIAGGAAKDRQAFITVITATGGNRNQPHSVKTFMLGGTKDDVCTAVTPLTAKRFVVAGVTESKDFPVTVSQSGGQYKQEHDAFAAVFDADVLLPVAVWCLGGTGEDAGMSVASLNGNLIAVAGTTASKDFPTADKPLSASLSGSSDAFVSVFFANGQLLYSTYLGGGGGDGATSVQFTEREGLLVAGSTSSADFPVSDVDLLADKHSGQSDCFITLISPQRPRPLYSTLFGGAKSDSLTAAAVALPDGFLAAGWTNSAADFRPKFINSPPVTDRADGFVTRCNVRPNVFFDGTTLSFPSMFVGASGIDSVIITATGIGAVEFEPFIADDPEKNFSAPQSGRKIILSAGERDTIYVVFAPKSAGGKKARLMFMSGKDTLRARVALSGEGKAPVELTAASVTFGNTEIGTASPAREIGVKNLGPEPCRIDAAIPEGNDAAFFTITAQFPITVGKGQTAAISAVFQPDARRAYSCAVIIKTNKGNLTAKLFGAGVGPAVTATAQSVKFDSAEVGSSSSKTLEISNIGEREAAFVLAVENDASGSFSITPPLTGTLASGGGRQVELHFTPKTEATATAVLVISGQKFPAVRVPLSGLGVGPRELSLRLLLDTIAARIGQTVEIPVRIAASSGFRLNVTRLYEAVLRYNGTVLGFGDSSYTTQTDPPWRLITLFGSYTLTGTPADSTLCRARLIAALGDTNATAVELASLRFFDEKNTVITPSISVRNGQVVVNDADTTKLPSGAALKLKAYPQPATGSLTLEITSPSPNPVLTLYSVTGAAVARIHLAVAPDVVQTLIIPTDRLGRGIYLAVLSAGAFTATERCYIQTP